MEELLEPFGEFLLDLFAMAIGFSLMGICNAIRGDFELPGGTTDPLVMGFIGRVTRDVVKSPASSVAERFC